MSLIQLDPPIPVITPLGKAIAFFVEVDYFDAYWCTFLYEGGEPWWWRNYLIRLAPSITMGHVTVTPIKVSPEIQAAIDKARARGGGGHIPPKGHGAGQQETA